MKLTNTIFILSLFICACEAGDINLDTLTVETDRGKAVYSFNISQARLDSQPSWKPGKQPVPLTIDKALQVAQAWIDKQSWSKRFEDFNKITLENQESCWYYSVYFDLHNQHASLHPTSVMILLDGSVVEPKIKHQKNANSSQQTFNADQ